MPARSSSLNVPLSPSLRSWIDDQVKRRKYTGPDAFLLDLVKQARRQQEEFDRSLIRAMKEPSAPMTSADWDRIRADGRARAAAMRAARAASIPARRKSA